MKGSTSRRTLLIAISAIFFLCAVFCSESKAANPRDASVVPKEVQSKLDKDYPDWQVEALENLDGEDRKMWTNAHPNDCPGIAVGHFQSKIELSYALLLVSKPERKRQGFRVVVFTRSGPSAPYVSRLVMKWKDGLYYYNSDQVIATVPPGHYTEAIGSKNVQTDLDAILCETLEKGAALYYFRNGAIMNSLRRSRLRPARKWNAKWPTSSASPASKPSGTGFSLCTKRRGTAALG